MGYLPTLESFGVAVLAVGVLAGFGIVLGLLLAIWIAP